MAAAQNAAPDPADHPGFGHVPCPDHPLTRGRLFYAVPSALLNAAIGHARPDRLDAGVVALDREIASAADADPQFAGFRNGQPVRHDLLRVRRPATADTETAEWISRELGVTAERARLFLETTGDTLRQLNRHRRAYCGWLTCNPQFVVEERALWATHAPQLCQLGVPVAGPAVERPGVVPDARRASGGRRAYLDAFSTFVKRWELAQLPGPGLPQPFGTQLPAFAPHLQPGHAAAAMLTLQVARTQPLPDGDLLRQALEEAADRGRVGTHLAAWMRIIAPTNAARQTLGRLSRMFEMQHFWRVLQKRYSNAFAGRTGRLEVVFARFLGVNVETVHADLQQIRHRLGPAWDVHPDA